MNSLEELINNPSFIRYVQSTDAQDVAFWEHWLATHPHKKPLADDAAMLVRGIAFKKQSLPAGQIETSWKEVERHILPHTAKSWFQRNTYAIAASLTLLLLSTLSIWFFYRQPAVTYQTAYGEIQKLRLPDGSSVTLNANSTLRYPPASMHSTRRIVHLQGEAYFEIVRKKEPVSFIVVTDNGEVEVLGTQFNVNSRHEKTKVVLNEGKVKFNVTEDQNTLLEPGDMVEYSKENNELKRQKVNPEMHSSWRNHKLTFDDTSLPELARILEDSYGLQVVISRQALLDKKITGEISAKNVDVILKAISKLLHVKVTRSGKTVYFS